VPTIPFGSLLPSRSSSTRDLHLVTPAEAALVLGIKPEAPWEQVRAAYRDEIRAHHPDRTGPTRENRAALINEAYRVLVAARRERVPRTTPPATDPPGSTQVPPRPPERDRSGAPPVLRIDGDTLFVTAPSDETFRWLLEAAHDVGEITYVDRSMPIMEVLCQFEGEPATSLVLTLQGRGGGTEVFCTVESIEARPAPPTSAVVDLLELALHRRRGGGDQSPSAWSAS